MSIDVFLLRGSMLFSAIFVSSTTLATSTLGAALIFRSPIPISFGRLKESDTLPETSLSFTFPVRKSLGLMPPIGLSSTPSTSTGLTVAVGKTGEAGAAVSGIIFFCFKLLNCQHDRSLFKVLYYSLMILSMWDNMCKSR